MSGSDRLENVNPQLFATLGDRARRDEDWDLSVTDPFDSREIFDLIRDINDPEHPLTLEQLNVVELDKVQVDDDKNLVNYTGFKRHNRTLQ